MTATVLGLMDRTGGIDEQGHRTYDVKWLVETDDTDDGPSVAFTATGLPAVGSYYSLGNDEDLWAFCWPNWKCEPLVERERHLYWAVHQTFTTKPLSRCQDSSIGNPLLEPPKLSGSFVTYSKEATRDRAGNYIRNSAYEQIRGAIVERDFANHTVDVVLNKTTLDLNSYCGAIHTVNDATLWGLPKRRVKLSGLSWERNLYGTCTFYYAVKFTFDIKFEGFDRVALDEGTRVLARGGTPGNPQHYIAYRDLNGEPARVILDGTGRAWNGSTYPGFRTIEFYNESNFLLLGIPSSL